MLSCFFSFERLNFYRNVVLNITVSVWTRRALERILVSIEYILYTELLHIFDFHLFSLLFRESQPVEIDVTLHYRINSQWSLCRGPAQLSTSSVLSC